MLGPTVIPSQDTRSFVTILEHIGANLDHTPLNCQLFAWSKLSCVANLMGEHGFPPQAK
jgi:hypothetical protein